MSAQEIVQRIAEMPEDERYMNPSSYEGEKECVFCGGNVPETHPDWKIRYEIHKPDCLYLMAREVARMPPPQGFPRTQRVIDAKHDCEVREAYGSVVVTVPELEISGIGDTLEQACIKLATRLNIKEHGKDSYGSPRKIAANAPRWWVYYKSDPLVAQKSHEELIEPCV